MKKILKLTLAVALMMCATVASAQKFGRVDLAAIVPNMPEFKEAQTNLEAYGLDLQNQLEQIQVEFNQKYAEYEKNRATYTDTIRQMKESELQQLQQRFQEFQQIAQQDIQQKEAELMEPIYNKANEAVKAVAEAGGYMAIFSTAGDMATSAGLAYFDPAALTDITAEVKKGLGIE
ncbi:MAG: OmpH family outer membrane protein [Alistipes sp.]|nr:OmpH family outer membrane protein [Rikenellaceae bacterium]MBQ2959176.1 OmpH family outer membrane protein [Alistipes sp.]MBQ3234133.1 OmpH family outer membrane protein [Alistipes sp.]MBR2110790.1 OmpH family outer membrane protein [Alistipes sp.]MBR2437276.1 OmpH family outer membrane protein [Alistipes sp.]